MNKFLIILFFINYLVTIINCFPLNLQINSNTIPEFEFSSGLLTVFTIICIVFTLSICLCCRKGNKGFQEFHDQSVILSTEELADVQRRQNNSSEGGDPGLVNPISYAITAFSTDQNRQNNLRRISKGAADPNKDVNNDLQEWFVSSEIDFPRTKLKYLRELGRGWFGRVIEGEALITTNNKSQNDFELELVVVRMLDSAANTREQASFLREVKFYKNSQHLNILKLLGRCLEVPPFLIIQEYCHKGDLKEYLRSNTDIDNILLLTWSFDIVDALLYLNQRNIAYNDLACRNCQLTNELSIRLGDYGLSQQKYPNDYYPNNGSSDTSSSVHLNESSSPIQNGSTIACQPQVRIPVRWFAPESVVCTPTTIQPRAITCVANVWSYGVVLWELITRGQQPYAKWCDDDVISYVLEQRPNSSNQQSRDVIEQDANCENEVPSKLRDTLIFLEEPIETSFVFAHNLYQLCRLCCAPIESRPSIVQVHSMIKYILNTAKQQIDSLDCKEFDKSSQNEQFKASKMIVEQMPCEISKSNESISDVEFQKRWQAFKPNTIVNCDYTNVVSAKLRGDLCASRKTTSSNNNVDNKLDFSNSNYVPDLSSDKPMTDLTNPFFNAEIMTGEEQYESWLANVAQNVKDPHYVKGLSQAMKELDNAVAHERSSSSSETASYHPSPRPPDLNASITTNTKHNSTTESSSDEDSMTQVELTTLQPQNVSTAVEAQPPYSSTSSDDDETWRNRIERGAYSEKVRIKSKSVTDLMVLTHIGDIDLDPETDIETPTGTPLNSLDLMATRLRTNPHLQNTKIFGSDSNLINSGNDNDLYDKFQEELKRLQETRRDSIQFVSASIRKDDNDMVKKIEEIKQTSALPPAIEITEIVDERENKADDENDVNTCIEQKPTSPKRYFVFKDNNNHELKGGNVTINIIEAPPVETNEEIDELPIVIKHESPRRYFKFKDDEIKINIETVDDELIEEEIVEDEPPQIKIKFQSPKRFFVLKDNESNNKNKYKDNADNESNNKNNNEKLCKSKIHSKSILNDPILFAEMSLKINSIVDEAEQIVNDVLKNNFSSTKLNELMLSKNIKISDNTAITNDEFFSGQNETSTTNTVTMSDSTLKHEIFSDQQNNNTNRSDNSLEVCDSSGSSTSQLFISNESNKINESTDTNSSTTNLEYDAFFNNQSTTVTSTPCVKKNSPSNNSPSSPSYKTLDAPQTTPPPSPSQYVDSSTQFYTAVDGETKSIPNTASLQLMMNQLVDDQMTSPVNQEFNVMCCKVIVPNLDELNKQLFVKKLNLNDCGGVVDLKPKNGDRIILTLNDGKKNGEKLTKHDILRSVLLNDFNNDLKSIEQNHFENSLNNTVLKLQETVSNINEFGDDDCVIDVVGKVEISDLNHCNGNVSRDSLMNSTDSLDTKDSNQQMIDSSGQESTDSLDLVENRERVQQLTFDYQNINNCQTKDQLLSLDYYEDDFTQTKRDYVNNSYSKYTNVENEAKILVDEVIEEALNVIDIYNEEEEALRKQQDFDKERADIFFNTSSNFSGNNNNYDSTSQVDSLEGLDVNDDDLLKANENLNGMLNQTFSKTNETFDIQDAFNGWYLHPQNLNETYTVDGNYCDEVDEDSYHGVYVDDESVEALRKELEEKLPQAQGPPKAYDFIMGLLNSCDVDVSNSSQWLGGGQSKPGTSAQNNEDLDDNSSLSVVDADHDEIILKYNNIYPMSLSPIVEDPTAEELAEVDDTGSDYSFSPNMFKDESSLSDFEWPPGPDESDLRMDEAELALSSSGLEDIITKTNTSTSHTSTTPKPLGNSNSNSTSNNAHASDATVHIVNEIKSVEPIKPDLEIKPKCSISSTSSTESVKQEEKSSSSNERNQLSYCSNDTLFNVEELIIKDNDHSPVDERKSFENNSNIDDTTSTKGGNNTVESDEMTSTTTTMMNTLIENASSACKEICDEDYSDKTLLNEDFDQKNDVKITNEKKPTDLTNETYTLDDILMHLDDTVAKTSEGIDNNDDLMENVQVEEKSMENEKLTNNNLLDDSLKIDKLGENITSGVLNDKSIDLDPDKLSEMFDKIQEESVENDKNFETTDVEWLDNDDKSHQSFLFDNRQLDIDKNLYENISVELEKLEKKVSNLRGEINSISHQQQNDSCQEKSTNCIDVLENDITNEDQKNDFDEDIRKMYDNIPTSPVHDEVIEHIYNNIDVNIENYLRQSNNSSYANSPQQEKMSPLFRKITNQQQQNLLLDQQESFLQQSTIIQPLRGGCSKTVKKNQYNDLKSPNNDNDHDHHSINFINENDPLMMMMIPSEDKSTDQEIDKKDDNDEDDDKSSNDDNSSRSSSSGEFVWKEGEHEESVHVRNVSEDSSTQKNQSSLPINSNENSLQSTSDDDEGDDDDDDDDDGVEFVPSAWDSQAVPLKSALKVTEDDQQQNKKNSTTESESSINKKCRNVWFKKQKYHCVYEYPREPECYYYPPPPLPSTAYQWPPQSFYTNHHYYNGNTYTSPLWGTPTATDLSSFADWELDTENILEDLQTSPGATSSSLVDFSPENSLVPITNKYMTTPIAAKASNSSSGRDYCRRSAGDLYRLADIPSDFDFVSNTSATDDDFYITSSKTPFGVDDNDSNAFSKDDLSSSYSPKNNFSQFFPGETKQQKRLNDFNYLANHLDRLHQLSLNGTSTNQNKHHKLTPDSGVEDITPATSVESVNSCLNNVPSLKQLAQNVVNKQKSVKEVVANKTSNEVGQLRYARNKLKLDLSSAKFLSASSNISPRYYDDYSSHRRHHRRTKRIRSLDDDDSYNNIENDALIKTSHSMMSSMNFMMEKIENDKLTTDNDKLKLNDKSKNSPTKELLVSDKANEKSPIKPPTFITFGKTRFSVMQVETPTEESPIDDNNRLDVFKKLPEGSKKLMDLRGEIVQIDVKRNQNKSKDQYEMSTSFMSTTEDDEKDFENQKSLGDDESISNNFKSIKDSIDIAINNLKDDKSVMIDDDELPKNNFQSNELRINEVVVEDKNLLFLKECEKKENNLNSINNDNSSEFDRTPDDEDDDDLDLNEKCKKLNDRCQHHQLTVDGTNLAAASNCLLCNKVLSQTDLAAAYRRKFLDRGEASLLDSTDEDSGIESHSSRTATLERRVDDVAITL